ncbi:MAG TPA: nucleoside deaminase [Longimicrobiales bacterium]
MPELKIGLPDWIDDVVDWDRTYADVADRVGLAILLARENVLRDGAGPFGAAVFETETGRLVAVGVNRVLPERNSVLHAEVTALMFAHRRTGAYTLGGAGMPPHDLATSCDPCAMCLGATLWSGVRRLLAGADREDAMAVGFDEGPVFPESFAYLTRRGIEVVRGIRRAEARAVLERYVERGGRIYNA